MSLIEVMAVVAIIGVLAALAAVGYGRWISSSKMAEATNMVAAIKNGQENYYTQVGRYIDISKGIQPPFMYPDENANRKSPWGAKCDWCTAPEGFQKLGVKADKQVYFGYATVADGDVCDPDCRGITFSTKSGAVSWSAEAGGPIKKPWYIVSAAADTNSNGVYAKVLAFSFGGRVIIDNEGE